MPVADIDVEAFLDRSGTPREALYDYTGKLFDRIVSRIEYALPGLDPVTIRCWVQTFLALLGVHPTLRGVWRAERVLCYLVPQLLHKSPPLSDLPALDILHALCATLTPPNQMTSPISLPAGRLNQEQSQLFTYHLVAYDPSQTTGPCNLYRLWGLHLHLGLRHVMSDTPRAQTWKCYATSARAFFKYFPHSTHLHHMPKQATAALFDEHVKRFQEFCRPRFQLLDWTEHTLETHSQRLKWLFQCKPLQPHGHQRVSDPGLVVRELVDNPSLHRLPQNKRRGRKRDDIDAVAIIGGEDEEESREKDSDPAVLELAQLYTFKRGAVSHRPSLPYRFVNRYILHQFPLWWDTRSLTKPELESVYHAIEYYLRSKPGNYDGLALFLGMLLYTGRTPNSLLDARLARYPSSQNHKAFPGQDSLFIDLGREVLFFKQIRLRSSYQARPEDGWLSSSQWIAVPIPSPILVILRRYAKWLKMTGLDMIGTQAFHVMLPAGQRIVLDKNYLRTLLKASVRHGMKMPPPVDIAAAFLPLLSHGLGLDDVASRLISGRGIGRTYAQIHYTHIPYLDLVGRYTDVCNQLHGLIARGLPGGGWWNISLPRVRQPRHTRKEEAGIGSPLILRDEVIRLAIKLLKAVVANAARAPRIDPITHHNAYTCYVYLMLLRLGVRPRNHQAFMLEEFIYPVEYLPISDKQSALYFEERVVRLPQVVTASLTQLARGRLKLQKAVFEHYDPTAAQKVPSDLLIFMTETGYAKRFRLSLFTDFLKEWGLDVLATAPRNIGRHATRSTLRQELFADDVIDAHMGHQRAGRGPLEHHATTCWGPALTLLQARHERMLQGLGFVQMKYFPFSPNPI